MLTHLLLLSAADSHHSHIFVDGQYPPSTSPGVPHLRFNRRASEASLASQVSGLADSYTVSNIATSKLTPNLLRLTHVFSLQADNWRVDIVISSLQTSPQHTNVKWASLKGPVCCHSWLFPTIDLPLGDRPCSRARKPVRCSWNPTVWSLSRARTLALTWPLTLPMSRLISQTSPQRPGHLGCWRT